MAGLEHHPDTMPMPDNCPLRSQRKGCSVPGKLLGAPRFRDQILVSSEFRALLSPTSTFFGVSGRMVGAGGVAGTPRSSSAGDSLPFASPVPRCIRCKGLNSVARRDSQAVPD